MSNKFKLGKDITKGGYLRYRNSEGVSVIAQVKGIENGAKGSRDFWIIVEDLVYETEDYIGLDQVEQVLSPEPVDFNSHIKLLAQYEALQRRVEKIKSI